MRQTFESLGSYIKFLGTDKRIDDEDWERNEIIAANKQFFENKNARLNKLIPAVYGSLENYNRMKDGKYEEIDRVKNSHELDIRDYYLIMMNDYTQFNEHKYQITSDEASFDYEIQPIKPEDDDSYEQLYGTSWATFKKHAEMYHEEERKFKLEYLEKINQTFKDKYGYDIEVDEAYEYYTSILIIQNEKLRAQRERYWAIFNDLWEERDKELDKIEETQLRGEIIELEEKELAELNEKKFILEDTFGTCEFEIDSIKRKINNLTYDLDILKNEQKRDLDLYEYRIKVVNDYTNDMDDYINKLSEIKLCKYPEDDFRLAWRNKSVVEYYRDSMRQHDYRKKREAERERTDLYAA